MKITLYKNSATPNRVDKTDFLTKVSTLEGVLRDETSVTNMDITIEYNSVPTFNYCYVPLFNRYYYITDITSIRNNVWELTLSVDVLMTYKDGIYSCKGFVERNEDENNPNIVDNKRVIEQGCDVEEYTITNKLFDTEPKFVLQGLDLDFWTPSAEHP